MRIKNNQRVLLVGRSATITVLALAIAASAGSEVSALPSVAPAAQQGTAITQQNKFSCNMKALTPTERSQHSKLTAKLIAVRTDIVESAKGYEFQFSPSTMSLVELAHWAVVESQCCPFFDFHIDLENEGRLLCLRLTGEEGIKAFIRSEFQVPSK
jgi:hypothetical protein